MVYFYARGDADDEVAILVDEAACSLSHTRHLGSMKTSQDNPLVIKLPTNADLCHLVSLFSLGKEDSFHITRTPSKAVWNNLGCLCVD